MYEESLNFGIIPDHEAFALLLSQSLSKGMITEAFALFLWVPRPQHKHSPVRASGCLTLLLTLASKNVQALLEIYFAAPLPAQFGFVESHYPVPTWTAFVCVCNSALFGNRCVVSANLFLIFGIGKHTEAKKFYDHFYKTVCKSDWGLMELHDKNQGVPSPKYWMLTHLFRSCHSGYDLLRDAS